MKKQDRRESNKKEDCYSILVDGKTNLERTKLISDTCYRLNSYKKFLDSARKCYRDKNLDHHNLHKHLAERAYKAETDMRLLLKVGIDALNEIRDFGIIEKAINHSLENLKDSGFPLETLQNAFQEKRVFLAKYYSQIDFSFFELAIDQINKIVSANKVSFKKLKNRLNISFELDKEQKRSFMIEAKSSAGDCARIGSSEFFNSKNGLIVNAISTIPIPSNCHHTLPSFLINHKTKNFDIYGSIMGQFATAREMMYSHARKVDEMGVSYLSGNSDDWWKWLIGALCIVILIVILLSGGTVQLCKTDVNGMNQCIDLKQKSSGLTSSSTSALVLATISLAGIGCATLENGCSLQYCTIVSIQG